MKLIHQHPAYKTEEERLERLREVRKRCAAKLQNMRGSGKAA